MSTRAGKLFLFILILCFFLAAAGNLFGQAYSRDLYLVENRLNGPDVLTLQKKLVSLGFSVVGKPDSWFGPDTETGVKQLQGWLGFPVNGKITEPVWKALFAPRTEAQYFQLITAANAVRIDKLEKTEKDLMEWAPEGGEADVYLSGISPVYAVILLYGEMSQVRYDVYYFKNDTFLVLETWARYPETFDLDHATYEYTGYCFSPAGSYSVKNGLPVKAAYDSIKVIEMLDGAMGDSQRPDIGD
jgi:hypothetical protein